MIDFYMHPLFKLVQFFFINFNLESHFHTFLSKNEVSLWQQILHPANN
jgi:hypothetical protein